MTSNIPIISSAPSRSSPAATSPNPPTTATRTYSALINTYTHGALAATLFKAEDELRETSGFTGTFLVSHINGGVAGVAKTKAIDTIESGPILGIHASAYLAKAYGLHDVIAMDIGGTTAKISVLRNGEPVYRKPSDFFGIPVAISLPDLRSVALGGGSVVKPLPGSHPPAVQLGPESMGSYPGPACYGLGGDQPTLTDAFVTAGLINPDYFLGGAKTIDRDLARQSISDSVAAPLQVSTEEACRIVIARAFASVAAMIAAAGKELRHDLSQSVLFAYGGNGSLFACGVADLAGLSRVQVFSLGPVFSAFGSSVSDILHVYESSLAGVPVSAEGLARIRHLIDDLKAEGVKDLLGEGIKPENIKYAVEIEATEKEGPSFAVPCSAESFTNEKSLQAALAGAAQLSGTNQARRPQARFAPRLRQKDNAQTQTDRAPAASNRFRPRLEGNSPSPLGQRHRRSQNLRLGPAATRQSDRRRGNPGRRQHHLLRPRKLDPANGQIRQRRANAPNSKTHDQRQPKRDPSVRVRRGTACRARFSRCTNPSGVKRKFNGHPTK